MIITGDNGSIHGSRADLRPALEVRDLDVPFGEEPGLRGISFQAGPGERFALVGASGAGKTSLLRAVAGSGSMTAGRVLVEGRDLTGIPQERRGMVLLAQRPLLFPHLSVFENVAFPLRVRGVKRHEIHQRVREALALVSMGAFESRRPQALSGGQAHRVALARAVVARPPVLLLDEPLTSLDPSLRDEIRRSILEVHAEYKPALVLVTHDLQEAGRMADRVGVVLDGVLAQVDSPEMLFRRPRSVAVARFLGLPNEVPGCIAPDGGLALAGWRVGSEGLGGVWMPEEGGEGRAVTVVFGADAGQLVPLGSGAVPARVEEVHHHPQGATARVTLGERGRKRASRSPEAASCEVAVNPASAPRTGEELGVTFHTGRMHIFDASFEGSQRVPSPEWADGGHSEEDHGGTDRFQNPGGKHAREVRHAARTSEERGRVHASRGADRHT